MKIQAPGNMACPKCETRLRFDATKRKFVCPCATCAVDDVKPSDIPKVLREQIHGLKKQQKQSGK